MVSSSTYFIFFTLLVGENDVAIALTWKMGFEIELLAPKGSSRKDLADQFARQCSGSVNPFFHPQSEPSEVPERPIFENLTLGFEVGGADGKLIASFVDDLTLQADLDKQVAPVPGWYRIVADDARILRLVMRHCDACAPIGSLLEPLAGLFGTELQQHDASMTRVVDDRGISVAIGARLPGERERPCEIVTAPISSDHGKILVSLLADAKKLGFTIPFESATHIHFDAASLCSAHAIAKLVAVFERFGDDLKQLVGVNQNCVRLKSWPRELSQLTSSERFQSMDWPEARAALGELSLTKYCDFNILNIVNNNPAKHTFEVRILPVTLEAEPIVEAAALFEKLLRWCADEANTPDQIPETMSEMSELT